MFSNVFKEESGFPCLDFPYHFKFCQAAAKSPLQVMLALLVLISHISAFTCMREYGDLTPINDTNIDIQPFMDVGTLGERVIVTVDPREVTQAATYINVEIVLVEMGCSGIGLIAIDGRVAYEGSFENCGGCWLVPLRASDLVRRSHTVSVTIELWKGEAIYEVVA
jgi:hypothetical protein